MPVRQHNLGLEYLGLIAIDVDIEDLYDIRCNLLCAPTIPTQTEDIYPLSQSFILDNIVVGVQDSAHFLQDLHLYPNAVAIPNSSQPAVLSEPQDSGSMCLLERVNPEYFERDKYKYRWQDNTVRAYVPHFVPCDSSGC